MVKKGHKGVSLIMQYVIDLWEAVEQVLLPHGANGEPTFIGLVLILWARKCEACSWFLYSITQVFANCVNPLPSRDVQGSHSQNLHSWYKHHSEVSTHLRGGKFVISCKKKHLMRYTCILPLNLDDNHKLKVQKNTTSSDYRLAIYA